MFQELLLIQVRAVPIRKDDEVQVVRGTYKVNITSLSLGRPMWLQ